MRRWSVMVVIMVIVSAAMVIPWGCSREVRVTGDLQPSAERSQRLMALAAEEAREIADLDVRLTRQLNLADMQIQRAWANDARKTLAAAQSTLLESDGTAKLNDHARISGWVAVSELSRQVGDNTTGLKAVDQGVRAMRAIHDQGQRCQYVMGLANELANLKGTSSAAGLLAEAGPWTRQIDDVAQQRQAMVAFASALFNLDAYEEGQKMLRQDTDPAWRSETLVRLAIAGGGRHLKASARMQPNAAEAGAAQMLDEPYYGRQLNYRDVFQNQKSSKTVKD